MDGASEYKNLKKNNDSVEISVGIIIYAVLALGNLVDLRYSNNLLNWGGFSVSI